MRPRSRQREKITAAIPCDDSTSVAFVLNSDDNDVAGTTSRAYFNTKTIQELRSFDDGRLEKHCDTDRRA